MDRTPHVPLGSLIAGAALGALAMYVFDPQSGRRRVALARDKTRRVAHKASDALRVGWRDLKHRSEGVAANVRRLSHTEREIDDRVLQERVRAELGHSVSHPRAIAVFVHDGCVELNGAVLAAEQARMRRAIESVPGVREVIERVVVHDSADGVPALQGGHVRGQAAERRPLTERAPATQLLGVASGVALAVGGAARGGLPGLALLAGGAALAAQAMRPWLRPVLRRTRSRRDMPTSRSRDVQQESRSRDEQVSVRDVLETRPQDLQVTRSQPTPETRAG